MLFRNHVSEQAAGKGKDLLTQLGFSPEGIAAFYVRIDPQSEIEAVQSGLDEWRGGRASEPTWAVLLKAMKHANITQEYCQGLKTELTGKQSSCMS